MDLFKLLLQIILGNLSQICPQISGENLSASESTPQISPYVCEQT